MYIFERHWLPRNAKTIWGLESPWNFLHFEHNRSSVAQILWKIEVFKQKNHKWCPSSCKLIFPIKILGLVFKQLYLLKFSSYRVGIARKMKGISRAFQTSHRFCFMHISKWWKKGLSNCAILMSRVVYATLLMLFHGWMDAISCSFVLHELHLMLIAKQETAFFIYCKSDVFAFLLVTFYWKKIEDRGLRHLKKDFKSFQRFFENLKSVKKQLRYGPP